MIRKNVKDFNSVPNFKKNYLKRSKDAQRLFDSLLKASISEFSVLPLFDWGFFNKENVATAALNIDIPKIGRHFCYFDVWHNHVRIRMTSPGETTKDRFNIYFISEIPNTLNRMKEFLNHHYDVYFPV